MKRKRRRASLLPHHGVHAGDTLGPELLEAEAAAGGVCSPPSICPPPVCDSRPGWCPPPMSHGRHAARVCRVSRQEPNETVDAAGGGGEFPTMPEKGGQQRGRRPNQGSHRPVPILGDDRKRRMPRANGPPICRSEQRLAKRPLPTPARRLAAHWAVPSVVPVRRMKKQREGREGTEGKTSHGRGRTRSMRITRRAAALPATPKRVEWQRHRPRIGTRDVTRPRAH